MALTIASAVITDQTLVLTLTGGTGAITCPGNIGVYARFHITEFYEIQPFSVGTIVGNVVTLNMVSPFPASGTIGLGTGGNAPAIANFQSTIQDSLGTMLSGPDVTGANLTNASTMLVTRVAFDPTKVGMNGGFGDGSDSSSRTMRTLFDDSITTLPATMDTIIGLTPSGSTMAVCVAFDVASGSIAPLAIATGTGSYGAALQAGIFGTATVTVGLIGTGLSAGNLPTSFKAAAAGLQLMTGAFLLVYGGTVTMSQPLSTTSSAPSFWASVYETGPWQDVGLVLANSTPTGNCTFETGTNTVNDSAQGWRLTTGFFTAQSYNGASLSIHCLAKPTKLKLFCNQTIDTATSPSSYGGFGLLVDNADSGSIVMSGSGAYFLDFTALISGVSAGAHDFYFVYAAIPTRNEVFYVRVVGTTVGTPPALRNKMTVYGDSNAAIAGPITADGIPGALNGWPRLVAINLGMAYLASGVGATGTHGFTGAGETNNPLAGEERTAQITNCTHPDTITFDAYASNDVTQFATGFANRPFLTTTQSITASGSPQNVTVSGTAGIINGQTFYVDIGGGDPINDPGPNCEPVVITVVGTAGVSTTIQGTFLHNHSSGITISRPLISTTEFQPSTFIEFKAILDGLPGTSQLVVLGIIPNNVFIPGQTNYGLSAAISASANIQYWSGLRHAAILTGGTNGNGSGTFLTSGQRARCKYIDMGPANLAGSGYPGGGSFTQSPNYDSSLVHLSDAGHAAMAAYLISALASPATSYTQTLSASSGFTGNPVTITYTPNGSTTAVVTPNPTPGVAGTYSPTTVTLNNTTPVTQTFTPTAAGTASLVPTNGGGLTNPGANTYTVALASVTSTIGAVTWNIVGVGTLWTGTPFTLVSGGGSITAQSVSDNTHASVTITGGTSPWVVSDGSRQFTLKASSSGGGGGSGSGQTFIFNGTFTVQ